MTDAGLSSLGMILADQLTLYKPGGRLCPPSLLGLAPPDFQTLRRPFDVFTIYYVGIYPMQSVLFRYSRVHKSPPPFFSKILEKPSIVQTKMIPNINGLGFSLI